MKIRPRTLAACAAAALSTTLLVAMPASAQPTLEEETPGTIEWEPCEDAPDAYCGSIEVPVNWDEPDGDTIEIAMARRAATDPDERLGTIVMNPGGPGGSGVEAVKNANHLTADVAAKYDYVGFDPRGINETDQVECNVSDVERSMMFQPPESALEFTALSVSNTWLAAWCEQMTGPIYQHVHNLQTIHDMDAIRDAVGDEKLNFLGFSYGTLMGQQYAEEFPDNVGALVLDGNMDHSLETAWDFVDSETLAAERNFDAWADWCSEESTCVLHGEDIPEFYSELREAVRDGDVIDPETGEPMTFTDFNRLTFAGANLPPNWASLAEYLVDLHEGNEQASIASFIEPVNYPGQAIWCQDWDYPVNSYGEWAGFEADLAQKYPNLQWTPYNNNLLNCVGYPGQTHNPQQPLDIDEEVDLVMIGTVHDWATTYEWSQSAAAQAGSAASLVTYEGFGHTIYGQGHDCIDEAIDAYFLEGIVPEDGLTCESRDYFDPDVIAHVTDSMHNLAY